MQRQGTSHGRGTCLAGSIPSTQHERSLRAKPGESPEHSEMRPLALNKTGKARDFSVYENMFTSVKIIHSLQSLTYGLGGCESSASVKELF